VRFSNGTRWSMAIVLAFWVALGAAGHADDKKEKSKTSSAQIVDSGAFGIFVKGQRVVTETFSVEQRSGVSLVKSQLKEMAASDSIKQKSELEFNGDGALLRYQWDQNAGGAISVLPNNDFLIEKITTASSGKPAEQPFLMPNTTVILDNNFFIHREVLAWRYLAADCKPENGNLKCQQGPVEFGVLVPQDRTSLRVRLELVGKEKVQLRGSERELVRLNLTSETSQWALWVDDKDQFKLMKVAIPADDTEVIRD